VGLVDLFGVGRLAMGLGAVVLARLAPGLLGLCSTGWPRFGVILRKVWGGSRTWPGARAQSVLMSVWRTCWQQGRSALDFLSQLLRGKSVALAPLTHRAQTDALERRWYYPVPADTMSIVSLQG
jgi:transposase